MGLGWGIVQSRDGRIPTLSRLCKDSVELETVRTADRDELYAAKSLTKQLSSRCATDNVTAEKTRDASHRKQRTDQQQAKQNNVT